MASVPIKMTETPPHRVALGSHGLDGFVGGSGNRFPADVVSNPSQTHSSRPSPIRPRQELGGLTLDQAE